MPTFHVVINGHIDRTRKPDALPDVIHQVWVDEVDTPAQLAERIMERLAGIREVGGMIARLKPFEGMEPNKPDKRVWVPLHMITYVDTNIKGVTGEMPAESPDTPGEFVDANGKKVGLQ